MPGVIAMEYPAGVIEFRGCNALFRVYALDRIGVGYIDYETV